jgi:hypothetical protein
MPDKDKVESLLKLADFSWRDYSDAVRLSGRPILHFG